MTESLTSAQSAYLADNMIKVSRSFAVVAPEVESPMDAYLGAAYLICRVVDNIEDTKRPFSWKRDRFMEFEHMLEAPDVATTVLDEWEREQWPGLSDDEQHMMGSDGGLMLWEIYAGLPDAYRHAIGHWGREMAMGMQRSVDPRANGFFHERDGVRLPHSKADYDCYCFYVAGTVGRMITEMMAYFYDIDEQTAARLGDDSETCGRGLQKTNITKDFAKDLRQGVSFLPDEWLAEVAYAPLRLEGAPPGWKRGVLLDVLSELDGSVAYLTGLPQRGLGFRKAGLLMLIPAYDTLLLAAERLPDLFTPRHEVKIPRAKMMQAVSKAQRLAGDDAGIRALSAQMSGKIQHELDGYG